MNDKTFIIDGDHFSNLDGFYDEVQKVLTKDFRGFGRNLYAFNDILLGGFGKFEPRESIQVLWKNSSKSRRDLGYPETTRYRREELKRVHPSNMKTAEKYLELAEKGEGPTLFDILVEIIKDNKNVKLALL